MAAELYGPRVNTARHALGGGRRPELNELRLQARHAQIGREAQPLQQRPVLLPAADRRPQLQERGVTRRAGLVAPPVQRLEAQHEEDGRRTEQEEARQRALRARIVPVAFLVVSIMDATHRLAALRRRSWAPPSRARTCACPRCR